jgi:hypothetical protein
MLRAPPFMVLVVLTAGCVGGPAETKATTSLAPSGDGAITGVILDDSLQPVADATVRALKDQKEAASTKTDAGGAFALRGLAPGTYLLSVSKPGFKTFNQSVDVIAGNPSEVRMGLVSAPIDTSYHQTMNEAGVVLCGVALKAPLYSPNNTTARGNVCVLAAQSGQTDVDRAQIRWFFKFTNSSGYISETTWKPSSSLTKRMDLFWTPLLDDGASTPAFYGGGSWTSPMRARVPIKMVFDQIKKTPTQSCKPDHCMLLSYHYVGGSVLDDTYPVNAGAAYNQRYDVWTTVFYNGELPETFSVLGPK